MCEPAFLWKCVDSILTFTVDWEQSFFFFFFGMKADKEHNLGISKIGKNFFNCSHDTEN